MVQVQPRHRKLIATHLEPGEQVIAILHTDQGKAGPTTASGATAGSSTGGGRRRYLAEHGIVEKGVNGVFDLADTWLALTDRRLAFFKGAWFTLLPKPKKHILDMPADSFTVKWKPENGPPDRLLLHFLFPGDENLVVLAEAEDAEEFLRALGDRAGRI